MCCRCAKIMLSMLLNGDTPNRSFAATAIRFALWLHDAPSCLLSASFGECSKQALLHQIEDKALL